ncbi:dipeptidyl carboxypeptidase II [Salmonella enterica subsp. enterica serovar Choleraesuis]|nr:dipeptidyl carboxypeptidase II [Salmonella enterica subsp. enterica serovar Choleraesuis]
MTIANPFFTTNILPYQAPPFDLIKIEHFRPAFDRGVEQKRKELAAIVENKAPADFANTCEALEVSGELLARVCNVFYALASADTNPQIQALEEAFSAELAQLNDELWLNPLLFSRVDAIFSHRKTLGLEAEALRLLETQHQRLLLAGARLDSGQKERLKVLNQEAARLSSQFNRRLLAASKASGVWVDGLSSLHGLPADMLGQAKAAASAKSHPERWWLGITNTTQQPPLQYLSDRQVREQLFMAGWQRCQQGDDNDTQEVILRLAALRAERAELLGFADYASWSMASQMAGEPDAALDFMRGIVPAATARARQEQADLQQLIDNGARPFSTKAWDWDYYASQVRSTRYALDDEAVRPYFSLDRVLLDGVFYSASELFGISFTERFDIPVYHPDVRVWEIFDADGRGMALFYGDFFARESKSGGAWMGNLVEQSTLLEQYPVIYNVCNFTRPESGPALLSWDDVITLFHEFGHTLHGLFASQRYATLSGTNTPRDFVEFPSQINEHWASHPQVFNHYARHYKTGEAMPKQLQASLLAAGQFNKGYEMTELLAAALLDMHWHLLNVQDSVTDVTLFEKTILEQEKIALEAVPPRYRSSYFAHIWGGGYGAGYYAYLWTQMLADDGFQWFQENGGLTRENGEKFREMILSRGNSSELSALYRDWRGHDPVIEPMLKNRGLAE